MGINDKNQGMPLEAITKRKIKDSVFTDLFRNKKYLLQLYQTLHPEDKEVTENELEDVTIKHIMVDGDYNDLGFSAKFIMNRGKNLDEQRKPLTKLSESA